MIADETAALKLALRTANRMHVGLYRITRGRFANRVAGLPILLITTRGRKTGKLHTNPWSISGMGTISWYLRRRVVWTGNPAGTST